MGNCPKIVQLDGKDVGNEKDDFGCNGYDYVVSRIVGICR